MNVDVFPVSSGQERMWFLSKLEPDLAVYNINLWLPMRSPFDLRLLLDSLEYLVARHEPLRTSFDFRDGKVVQVIHDSAPVEVVETDLRELPPGEREAEFRRLGMADAARPFPLDRLPLFRARLVRLDAGDLRLILIFDHTIFDGASSGVLVAEVFACYDAFAAGGRPELPELPIQYADYTVWQRERLTEEFLDRELGYWRGKLEGLPADPGLTTDRPRPPVRSYRGDLHLFELSPELTARIEEVSRRLGATPFITLLAAFKAVLTRWSGRADTVVGTPVAARVRPELEPLIGMFVNAVVVRTDLDGDPTFADTVRRVRASLLEGLDHQEMPFERLVEALQSDRDLSRSPLYQIAFTMQPSDARGQIANGTVKVDLSLDLNLRDGRLFGRVEWATDLFDRATIECLAGTFETLLGAAVADPEAPISRLPLLAEDERQRLVTELGTGPETAGSPALIPDQFEAQAARTPDAVAVWDASERLTYAELDARASGLAHELRDQGVGPEVPVAVHMARSAGLVVAVLAVLKAGGVYVPLDPEHPEERRGLVLSDAAPQVVLTDAVPRPDSPTVGPSRALLPDNAAYVIYTSGSTGRPKGAVTSHRAIAARLEWMRADLQISPGDIVLHKTPVSFDVSVWELVLPLLAGAAVVVAGPGDHRDPAALRDLIIERGVTTAHFVPSMLEAFLAEEGIEKCASLRRVVCSGEELTRGTVDRFADRLAGVELHNLYGPTEAAIDVSAWNCRPGESGPVPIGRAVAGTRLRILDERLEPVPAGMPGELCIGGVQLARGYLGMPGRTAAAFVPDPYGPPGSRLYRTGDLARWRADGTVEFLGRIDTQVKVHGVRIELGEIETALSRHPQVRRAVAALRDDAPGGRGLVGYLDWTGDPDAVGELRDWLARSLPAAMIPQAFVLVEEFPALSSGKVDRARLPAPAATTRIGVSTPYVAPGTPLEEELAALWAGLLGRDRIGAQDDFFQLGGHSLLAVEMLVELRERYGVEIPLRRSFEITTVAAYALEILELQLGESGLDDLDELLEGL